MKIKFDITGLDCANCALELERSIKKVNGVKDCHINFIMESMDIVIDGDKDTVIKMVKELIKKEEPDCNIEESEDQ